MKVNKIIISLMAAMIAVYSCEKIGNDPVDPDKEPIPEKPEQESKPDTPSWPEDQQGKSYIWDSEVIPEVCIHISETNWNNILTSHDRNRDLTPYLSCNIYFDKDGAKDTVKTAGVRIRDNANGNRPEGANGDSHSKKNAEWNLSNFEIDFDYFKEGRTLRNVKGILLRSCVNDPTFARERYCHDLFRKFGIWSIPHNTYCRLTIKVEGDAKPAYLGIYQMVEPVDQTYINDRTNKFKGNQGFLWKCSEGAFLRPGNIPVAADNGKGESKMYLLMNNQDKLSSASAQLNDFITKLNTLKDKTFKGWIVSVMDVKMFLRTYAVISTVGMYDDYWNTGNNYFLFFNSFSTDSYKVSFIPFDFEKSLGNNETKDSTADPAVRDPYQWGRTTAPLMARLMQYEEFREVYTEALYELTLPEAYLFNNADNIYIIRDLMYQVSDYTKNDTGTCMKPTDATAVWSTNKKYNLTQENEYNFFQVRSESIISYIE